MVSLPVDTEERGVQCLVGDKAWHVKRIRGEAEKAVRETLERDGCHNIVLLPPDYIFIELETDAEVQFEPHWAWAINAVGERKKEAIRG